MTYSEGEAKKKKRSRYGIKWKMYAILLLFLCFSLIVIWLFQVQMLSYFYQGSKFGELENTALSIMRQLGAESGENGLSELIDKHSEDYGEDIWVCRKRENGSFVMDGMAQNSNDSVRGVIVSNFSTLYEKATENEGTYIALVTSTYVQNDRLLVLKDNMGSPDTYPYKRTNSDILKAIHVTTCKVGGESYMIVQSTSLTPIFSVTNTMKNQFLWIGVILSIAALIVATLMTRMITKPIEKINNSAKRLAKGEYAADFTVSGYLEIDELADTLRYASDELAKTDNLQKELISNVSHDLRTPLTMIKGYSEVMRDIPGENSPENIQIIIDETTRLSELVNDMLDLSKIQSGTRKTEMQTFSLTSTVRDVMQRYERLTMQDGYLIEFISDTDVNVYADRGMILQVVYNLINNAINYTGADKKVTVTQSLKAGKVRISVTDTGEGIDVSELSVIWDRYYRVDKVHKRATVGTGLGLSIVKGVLELHRAEYGVSSIVGEGSTFWFELDAVSGEEKKAYDGYIEADYEKQGADDEDITRQ